MKTNTSDSHRAVFHHDGTVTYWDVYSQTSRRRFADMLAADAQAMSCLPVEDRRRIEQIAAAL